LLEAGAKTEANEPGSTLLLDWVQYSPVDMTQVLIEAGGKIDQAHKNGITALIWAIVEPQRVGNVAAILKHGADPEKSSNGFTPLMRAASGNPAAVQALLEAGAKVNQAYWSPTGTVADSNWGFTPLMFAAYHGQTFIVRMLLRAGADVNMLNGHKGTALICAVRENHLGIVRLLLEAGADCRPRTLYNETAYSIASTKGFHEIAMLLQQHMQSQ
jgi:ankyrin repeat protein